MRKLFLFPVLILLVISFILAGCSQSAPTTSAPAPPPTTSAPTAAAPTTSAPTTTAPTAAPTTAAASTTTKTFTFGVVTNLTNSLGIQNEHWFETIADMVNANGGLKIGNDTYMMKAIVYSDDGQIDTGVAADNRLIYQDHVQYIINHDPPTDSVLPITDPAHVLDFSNARVWNSGLMDKWHYSFSLLGQGTHEMSVAGWLIEHNPDMKGSDGLAMACPDNSIGHITASLFSTPYKRMGADPQIIYYPATQQDLSSLGTKLAVMNPAWLMADAGAGVEGMALVYNAAYDAGYRGHDFSFLTSDVGDIAPLFEPGVLNGYICAMSAMEYGDYGGCMTQLAETMKQAYVAKYGKWDYADYMTTPCLFTLMAALQKAGTTNVDTVTNVMHQGLSGVDVPDGTLNMITRPDINTTGNAIDAVMDNSLKQIENGKAVLLAHFGPDQSLQYERQDYPPLQPGQTPSEIPPV